MEKTSSVLNVEDGSIELAGVKMWLIPAQERDKGFIISTWYGSYNFRVLRPRVEYSTFKKSYKEVVERLWSKAYVLQPDDPTLDVQVSAGYIVYDVDINCLHYIYVIPELRRKCLAKNMIRAVIPDGIVDVSNAWPYEMPRNWRYNPYVHPR